MKIRRKNEGGIMAFGLIQLGSAAAALNETKTAYEILTWLGNNYWNNNLVSTHDPHTIFNVDICGGYPSLIMKMLYYSETGLVSLFPCKPQEWAKGSIKNAALRGGIILKELTWDHQEGHVIVVSQIDQKVKLLIDGRENTEVELKSGQPKRIAFKL